MTERLYYEDSYLLEFEAVVTDCREGKKPGTWEAALDRSAFYPTSGGQPYDTGSLRIIDEPDSADEARDGKSGAPKGEKTAAEGTAAVTDVEADREGIVWHTLNLSIPVGSRVFGSIDADRRRDHMEQHGGEHMLAGAIWEKLRGTTIGLHLGQEFSTIDVDMPDGRTRLTEEEIWMLEDTVNRRIRQDDPIRCWFPTEEELKTLPLRKPPTVSEHVRIVAIGDYEMVACGGTHPKSTGRIGQIKIISALPSKGKIRVAFVCGARAEKLFQKYMRSADKAGNVLSCPPEKLASSAGELKKRIADAEHRINCFETERIYSVICSNEKTGELNGIKLSVTFLNEGDPKPAMEAVSRYISEKGRVLLLWIDGRLTYARSEDVNLDMSELIRRTGRGGGRPELASGAGIRECLDAARKILITETRSNDGRVKKIMRC